MKEEEDIGGRSNGEITHTDRLKYTYPHPVNTSG